MRLLVHNFLQCHVKNCSSPYPIPLKVQEWVEVPVDYSRDAALHLLPKVDWPAFVQTVTACGLVDAALLPIDKPDDSTPDSILSPIMNLLLGKQVKTGEMKCAGCGHTYPITDSIPNMLLNEDEI